MPDGGNDPIVGAGGLDPSGTPIGRSTTHRPPIRSGGGQLFFAYFSVCPRGEAAKRAVPVNGAATIGGSPKDFNDMRRQARPAEYGAPGRRFQR